MTKTEAAQPFLFRSVKGSRKGSIQPLACALIVDPTESLPVATIRLSWSELLAARLRGIAKLAADSGEAEGKSLPYASLRAALQAQLPEAVLLARDLGAPWKKEERFPFLDVEASGDPARNPAKLAASALKTWMTMVLRPWAERVGIDNDLMDAVQDLVTPDDAFEVTTIDVDLGARIREGDSFDRLKHGILQVIAKRLDGQELFEGLGPVYRVVRGSSASNEISFQTWPATAEGARYSMVATLTVESGPFIGRPVVTVRASRRRWYDALPEPKRLYRLRTMTGSIMGKGKGPVAIEFTTPVRKGVPDEPFSPEFMIQALTVRQDLAAGLADMVARQGAQNVFVGIPYAPQLGGKHPVGSGATTRDQIDLFDIVSGLLADDGFRPLPFRQTEVNKKAPKRAEDQHKALQAEALIADIALSLGRNHLDGEALVEACRTLMRDGDVPELRADTALKARCALEQVREANRARVRRAFGDTKPTVVVLGRTDRERAVVRSVVTGLFGAAVELAEYQLPTGVHGARADLPAADKKARERFEARIDAWTPLAQVVAAEHQGCHVLVQATDWYDRRKDDPVNKLAGRYALASRANANVQYLRPPAAGWRGLANYLHRVQAAVYDLLFGHSGLVSEVKSLLKGAFPKEATRPTAIIGISVVTQARLRYGAGGGRLCLATRVDAGTGRTTARVGWFNGVMRWSEHWEPFFEAMKRIADPKITATLGEGRNVERDSFQKFVKTVIDGAVEAGDRPLVLIDSTSAAGLWPWLTDVGIVEAITLGTERLDMSVRWPGVRLVRVRTGRAGRVVERKSARYERVDGATGQPAGVFVDRYCPAITERTIRLADSPDGRAAHYWMTAGYFQMSIPRGLSVYRNLTSYVPAKKAKNLALPTGVEAKGLFTEHAFDIAKAPYRLPNAIDVTVANTLDGDDPDRIVHLVASLRCGYGHTKETTTLPAPLSFESKARDYMTRFVLDEAEAMEVLDADDDGLDADVEDGEGEAGDDAWDAEEAEPDGTVTVRTRPDAGSDDNGQDEGGPDDDGPEDGGGPGGGPTPEAGDGQAEGDTASASTLPPQGSTRTARPKPLSKACDVARDPWDVLIERFGVSKATTPKIRLSSTTSLASKKVVPDLPGAGRAPAGRNDAAFFACRSTPKGPPPDTPLPGRPPVMQGDDAAPAVETNDENEHRGEDSMGMEANKTDLWPETPRSPVLPVPSFVTREWLKPKISAPPSLIREIHAWRSEIQALSGFPWPKQRPTPDEFLDLVLEGFRYPGFIRAVTRVGARHLRTVKKREAFILFEPYRKYSGHVGSRVLKQLKRKEPDGAGDMFRLMIEAGEVEVAISRTYLMTLGIGYADDVLDVARDFPEQTGELIPFLEAVTKHLTDSTFNWHRDIVEQRGVPLVPPGDPDSVDDAPGAEHCDGTADESDLGQSERVVERSENDTWESGLGADAADPKALEASAGGEDMHGVAAVTENIQNATAPSGTASNTPAAAGAAPDQPDTSGENMAEGDPMTAAQDAWLRILTEVSRVVMDAASGLPSVPVIDGLIGKLEEARTAALAWEEAKPKSVDPAPMVAEARELAGTLAGIAKTEAPALSNVPQVTSPAAKAAEDVLAEVRVIARQVQSLIDQAKALSQDFDHLEEAAAVKKRGLAAARGGLAVLDRFVTVLADGVVEADQDDQASAKPLSPSVETKTVTATVVPMSSVTARPEPVEDAVVEKAASEPAQDAKPVPDIASEDMPVTATDMEVGSVGTTTVTPASETATATTEPVRSLEAAPEDIGEGGGEVLDGVDDSAMDLLMEEAALGNSGIATLVAAPGPDGDAGNSAADEDARVETETAEAGIDAPAEDPLALSVERKLIALVEAEEFGLAYHLLRAAARVFPDRDFPFTEPELRLFAMAGHINHAALQSNEALNQLIEEVQVSVQVLQADLASIPADVAAARRIALLGATATIALFHTDSAVGEVLEAINGIAPGLYEGLYPLKDALMEASRANVGLTPAMLRAVSRAAEEDRYGQECLKAVREKIEAFAQMRFRFQLGGKIRQVLIRNDGAIGKLKERLDKGDKAALDATREFADAYSHRSGIIALLEEAEVASNNFKFQGIDGDARERLVANIADLAALCREYVQARDAVPTMKSAGQRAIVTNIRDTVLVGLEKAVPTLTAYAGTAGALPAAAVRFTLRLLERLRAAVDGKLPQSGTTDHLLALHGPLLWLPRLRFGRSWLPSPYQPEIMVGTILAVTVPVVPRDGDRFTALDAALRDRLDEDSYVAARLLAEGGAFYGAAEAQRGQLRELIENNVQTRRDKLSGDIAEVRRMVDRVQRMGMLRGVDDAQSLLSLLDRIDPSALPAEASLDSRDEDEENELILDFASAEAMLDDVRIRVQRLIDKPRQDLLCRLDTLAVSGRVSPEDADRVRGLITKDDLLTAGEYMGFLEEGRALPETSSPNPRFLAFFPAVTDALERADRRDVEAMAKNIEDGRDFGPLAYSRIPENRREDALALLEDWKELRKRVQGGFMLNAVIPLIGPFLERAGLSTELAQVDSTLSKPVRKVYVAEMRLVIPTDAESVLLPDFGSQTGGNYRICVAAKMPSESELTSLCAAAGTMGVIVLVTSPVETERRRQLAWNSVDQNRRVLVLDEAIFLFALSEPEFRPLTMIECAQPFSFAAPYRDYGNQAVPPEMFFGRETEYRKLLEASGSCIVYGGRRLGKTALLQHVKATQHDPANGMAVGYANILSIGNNVMPSRIWEYASRELPALFPEPVSTASEFTAKVKAWLDADTRRRVLVLFDESDRFIARDADNGFREFIRLQALMDGTSRRFKFVLAGLHNVTRLVHTENPPLKQIASDPQRIGPLMDEELADAELLVTQPLAAMGLGFENREDVWRILSHCNYYPVLVQTFCKGLLEDLRDEVVRRKRPIFAITSEHVRAALENETIAQEIGRMFDYTISEIEDRYALIANIMAERALEDSAAGRVGEGMSAVDVLNAASKYWPAAFAQVNRLSVIEDLLDEMEGLGVLRRVGTEAWALRSHTILRLLGSETKIMAKLLEFIDRSAPDAFEPRSMRRPLHLPALYKVTNGHLCPLTLGQEHDLLTRDPAGPGQTPVQVRAIFGNALADQSIVAAAMQTAGPLVSDGTRVHITAQVWRTAADLLEAVGQAKPKDTDLALLVVDSKSEWDGDWVEQALLAKPVRDGRVRLAFVGGPQHALRWVTDPRFQPLPPQVRAMPLQPWTAQMVDHYLRSNDLSPEQYRQALRTMTGGFNRPMSQLLSGNISAKDRFMGRIEKQREKLLTDKNLWTELGLVTPMDEVFRGLPDWIDADGRITAYEVEGILAGVPAAQGFTGLQVVEFGTLMGLLEPEPVLRPGVAEDGRGYALNPLLAAALKMVQPLETA